MAKVAANMASTVVIDTSIPIGIVGGEMDMTFDRDIEKLKNSARLSHEERANAMTDMLLSPASWTSDVNISIRSQHIFIFPTAGFADEICLHLFRRFLLLPPLVVAKATKGLGRLIHAPMSYPLVNKKS